MGEGREKYEAFVTLATNDTYALGCLVLGNSLRRVATTRQLAVMVTQGVSPSVRNQLSGVFDHTFLVNILDSSDTSNLELLGRPDLSVTFTKIHCWKLTQFKKCVFMDADTLVVKNIDELFDREELSAAPDPGWPDCFNSGVFVYVPSEETYRNLLAFAVTSQSFDGGDQGLLNLYFKGWATEDIGKHLPFIYNVVSQAFYSYLPAFKQFRDTIRVVHFIGPVKPWHHTYSASTRTVRELPDTGHSLDYLQLWWDIFMDDVQPNLDPQLGGIVGELAHINLQGGDTVDKDDRVRKLQWEQGHADYMGVDKFDNIKARLDEKIAEPTPSSSRSSLNKEEEESKSEESKSEVRPNAGTVNAGGISSQGVDTVSVASVSAGEVAVRGADVAVEDSLAPSSEIQEFSPVDLPSVEESLVLPLPTLVSSGEVTGPPLPATVQVPPAAEGQNTAEIFTISAPPGEAGDSSETVTTQVQAPSQQSAGPPVVVSPGQSSQPVLESSVSSPAVGKSVLISPGSASSPAVEKPVVTASTSPTVAKPGVTPSPSPATSPTIAKPGVTPSPSPATTSAVAKPGVTPSPSPATSPTIAKPGVTPSPSPATTSAVAKPGVTPSPSPATSPTVAKPGVTPSPSPATSPTVAKPGVTPSPSPATTSAVPKPGVTPSPSPATTSAVPKPGVTPSPSSATTATVAKPDVPPSPSPATTSALSKPGVTASSSSAVAASSVSKPGVASSSPGPANTSTAASKTKDQQPSSVTEAKSEPKVSESTPTEPSPTPEPSPVAVPPADSVSSKSTSSRPESLTSKPLSRQAADSSKSSFVSGLASKFAQPSPTSPVAAAASKSSPFSQLASKFDTTGAAKPSASGSAARSPGGTASSPKTEAPAPLSKKTWGQPPTK